MADDTPDNPLDLGGLGASFEEMRKQAGSLAHFMEESRRDQQRQLDEVARIQQLRDEHKVSAERATIHTEALISALVDLSKNQQEQLVQQQTLMTDMVSGIRSLGDHAERSDKEDADRCPPCD